MSCPTDSQNIPKSWNEALIIFFKIQYRNTCISNKIPRGGGHGVWEGLGMDKNMGFVIFGASSKYRNAKQAFPKDYGFQYHWTPKKLKKLLSYILIYLNILPCKNLIDSTNECPIICVALKSNK